MIDNVKVDMLQEINCPKVTADNEINACNLLAHLKSGCRWLAGGLMLGLLCAIGFIALVPPQYEAIAMIQPATVGILSASTNTTIAKGADVESAAQTLERLKVASFYTAELIIACDMKSRVNPHQALAVAMKPTLIKGNGLIQISYRAASPAIAEACVAGVVKQLAKVQGEIAAPLIKALEEQRQITKQQLDDAERFQKLVEKRVLTMNPSSTQFSESMLLLSAAQSKKDDISKLRRTYAEQSIQVSEPLTQPTKLFEPIYASDKAVFPKKELIVFGGLVAGFLAGLAALFLNQRWRQMRIAN